MFYLYYNKNMDRQKTCVICNKTFIPKNRQLKRKTCYDDHYFTCSICGKTFIDNKLQSSHKFCSKECRNKSRSISVKNTNLKRYGVTSTFKLESTKEKSRKTCEAKYGVSNPYLIKEIAKKAHSKEAEIKRISTMLERYGAKTKAPSFKDIVLKKYGVENISQTKEWKDKNSGKNHYMNSEKGRKEHPWFKEKSKEEKEIIKEKTRKTNLEKYGVPYCCMRPEARKSKTISSINKKWNEIIKGELEFPIAEESVSYDIKKNNTLIEINPTYSHNINECPWFSNKIIDKNYHLKKTEIANKHGYSCFHIFDWDDKEKIKNYFSEKTRLEARKLEYRGVDIKESNLFLDKYHFQNHCRGSKYRLGLFYNDELVQLMTFGKPRYNKNYDWELLRLCSNPRYTIIGGTQKLWKHRPKGTIISYCDISKFDGKIYDNLGFKLIRQIKPTCCWSKGSKMISNNLLYQKGFDILFKTNYGKGTSNKELMLNDGWRQVYNCGQKVFEFI